MMKKCIAGCLRTTDGTEDCGEIFVNLGDGTMSGVGGIGAKILSKMGWTEGTGLGAKRDGRTSPLMVKKRRVNAGIGSEKRPFQKAWWEKMMEDAYGKSDIKAESEETFVACGGRRCRPHGSAKLARLKAHEDVVKREEDEKCEDEAVRTKTMEVKKLRKELKDRKREKKKEKKEKMLLKGISKPKKEKKRKKKKKEDKIEARETKVKIEY